ncbi:MAG: hypothetical protein CMM61_17565 [Rhodospirillaceae bacterium]|nr:hypothetical protein [Rhodospirillaceae bacterium]
MKYLWLPCLILVLFGAPVARADFQAGLTAYEQGAFKAAMQAWLPLAAAGDPEAQFRVGRLYDVGEGTAPDGKQAVYWYGKAHKSSHVSATYNLARLYDAGEIVERDFKRAADLYLEAACKGDPVSQFSIGRFYMAGYGIKKDPIRAFIWFYRAERNGDKEAEAGYQTFLPFISDADLTLAQKRQDDWADCPSQANR